MKLDPSISSSSSLMSTFSSIKNKNRLSNTMARINMNKTNMSELRSVPAVSSGIPVISPSLTKTATAKNNSKNLLINKKQSNKACKRTLPSLELSKSTLTSTQLPDSSCKTKLRSATINSSIERNLDSKVHHSDLSINTSTRKLSSSSTSSSMKPSSQPKKPLTSSVNTLKTSSRLKVTSRTDQKKSSAFLPSSNSPITTFPVLTSKKLSLNGKNQQDKQAKNIVIEKSSKNKEYLNVDYFVESMIKCNISFCKYS